LRALSRHGDCTPTEAEGDPLALGAIAHNAALAVKGLRRAAYPFSHGAMHELPEGLVLADSYHCSRLNTNTGKLTVAMFEAVIAAIAARLPADRA